jgi:hypothetical protein
MFAATAPPESVILTPLATVSIHVTWKIHTVQRMSLNSFGVGSLEDVDSLSVAAPEMVISLAILTAVVHL